MDKIVDFNERLLQKDKVPASPLVHSEELRAILLAAFAPFLERNLEALPTAERWSWAGFVFQSGELDDGSEWLHIWPEVIDFIPDEGVFKGSQEVCFDFEVVDEKVANLRIDLHMSVADAEHVEKLILTLQEQHDTAPEKIAPGGLSKASSANRTDHQFRVLVSVRNRCGHLFTDVERMLFDSLIQDLSIVPS